MDTRVCGEWLCNNRVMSRLTDGKKRYIFIENAPIHKIAERPETGLAERNTVLELLPKNAGIFVSLQINLLSKK